MSVVTRLVLLLGLALSAVTPAAAQFSAPAEPCSLGTAEARLRGAEVEAALFTNGNLFFGNETTNRDGYLVPLGQASPNGRPVSPMFAADLWVGGLVSGEVRTAASRYTNFPFRPGLTGPDRTPPSPSECEAADRIWVVSRDDIERHHDGAPPTADLAEWPVGLRAPVLDGDGDPSNYNLAGGDQPAVRGDVTAFWAMTDTASDRVLRPGTDPIGAPLGLDVAVEAFALRQAQFGMHTFYRFTLTNRNPVPIDSAYVGFFTDPDLGNAGDDYVGTDTTVHLQYVYNAEDEDRVYGIPPAFGIVVAEGPVGLSNGRDDDGDGATDEPSERLGLTSTSYFEGVAGGPTADPSLPGPTYSFLQGLWGDGTPKRAQGNGYGSQNGAPITRFAFPGDPVTEQGWSEVNNDRQGTDNGSGDRRMSLATGPFRLAPDSSTTVTLALVFAQGTDRFDSICRLRGQARGVRAAVLSGTFDPARVGGPAPGVPLSVRRPYPNPFRDAATVELRELGTPGGATVRVSVYDVLGRRVVAPVAVTATPLGRIEFGRGLAPGVYVVRVEGLGFAEAFPVVKVR